MRKINIPKETIEKYYSKPNMTLDKIANALGVCKITLWKNARAYGLKRKLVNYEEKNNMWKGDNVGFVGLHLWVRRRMPKPEYCECCKERKAIDLANKGTYDRNLENWEWLCRRCHMTKDGRMNNLKRTEKTNIIRNCPNCNIEYRIIPSYIENGKGKYCSQKCYFEKRKKEYENRKI